MTHDTHEGVERANALLQNERDMLRGAIQEALQQTAGQGGWGHMRAILMNALAASGPSSEQGTAE